VEMRTVNSIASNELQGTSEGDRSQAVLRATAYPTEGNKNTRSRKLRLKFRKQ
jgi:hypothetical protein